jgi:hypothetical protein
MPLLDDAKNCFVGQTQIKQIYAGTDKVWPKGPVQPDRLSIHKYDPQGYYVVFNSLIQRGNDPCRYVQNKIQWRYKRISDSAFSSWFNFDYNLSYIKGTDFSPDVEWQYTLGVLPIPTNPTFQGATYEIRKIDSTGEGTWAESIVMDLNIPAETLPTQDYWCDRLTNP